MEFSHVRTMASSFYEKEKFHFYLLKKLKKLWKKYIQIEKYML